MMRRFTSLALAIIVPAFLLAVPAFGQSHGGGSSSGGSHGGGGGGGGHSGGGSSSGGSHASGGGGARSGGGGGARSGATGGSGTAVSRGRASSGSAGSTSGSAGATTATARRGDNRSPRTVDGVATGTPPYSRPRDGRTPVGTAVPRGTVPPTGGSGGFIPAGYYGGFFPFGYGVFGVPYGFYGGYYGGYYDPWYGGYPTDTQGPVSSGEEGSLRLKIKPKEAEVYVDGYYVGVVDDFNGVFQKLHLETGAHRMEIRAPGYEPLTFDIRITAGHKTTYEGELKKIQ